MALHNASLDNYGTLAASGVIDSAIVGEAGDAYITNRSGAQFDAKAGFAFKAGDGYLANEGLLNISGAGTATITARFSNNGGTVDVASGTTALFEKKAEQFSGNFNLSGGTARVVNGVGDVLNIYNGTIGGNGTVDGNLALGKQDDDILSPSIRPGNEGQTDGVLSITKSFEIFSDWGGVDITYGAPEKCSKIVVKTGWAHLKGVLTMIPAPGTPNPLPANQFPYDILINESSFETSGAFLRYREGRVFSMRGRNFWITYKTSRMPNPNTQNDVAIYQTSKIDGNVWHDGDMDGLQNGGPYAESEMTGIYVTVRLYDAETDELLAETTTDDRGRYTFDDVDAGDYYLEFLPPDNWRLTLQDADPEDILDSDPDRNTRKTAVFTLDPGEVDDTWDAGIYELAAVGDYVWCDGPNDPRIPHNGIQDNGEPGLAGLSVLLFDGAGNYLTGTTTDSAGHYEFRYLEPGLYEVRVVLPSPTPSGSYVFTIRYAGDDPTIDSNADASGSSGVFALKEGETDWTIDFGILGPPPDPNPGGEGPTLVGTVESYAVMTSGGSGSDPIAPAESGRSATAASAPAAAGGGEPAAKPTGTAVGQASISVAPDFSEWSDFVIDLGAHPRRHPVIAAQATGFRS